MKVFGTILIVVGLLWAFGGVYNCLYHLYSLSNGDVTSEFAVWAWIINVIVFIGPGITVSGIGALVRK